MICEKCNDAVASKSYEGKRLCGNCKNQAVIDGQLRLIATLKTALENCHQMKCQAKNRDEYQEAIRAYDKTKKVIAEQEIFAIKLVDADAEGKDLSPLERQHRYALQA